MKILKSLFEFYLKSSLHVSFAVWALYKISFISLNSTEMPYLDWLVFASSIVGYNIIKFGSIFIKNKKLISKSIILVTFFALAVGLWCFFYLDFLTQSVFILCFILVILYIIPNPSLNKNLRNLNGVKIFLVAFSWTLVSYVSLINRMSTFEISLCIIFGVQRFIFVLVATIPFEIRDIKIDKNDLGTLPQRFGIFKSKILGLLLLILNTCLFYFIIDFHFIFILLELFMYFILGFFLLISNANQPLNFTRFWIEGIPVFWIFILSILNQLF